MRKLRIFGLSLLILIMTTTTVFAANASKSTSAPAGGWGLSVPVDGQNKYGKITVNSSGGGSFYYTTNCGVGSILSPEFYLPSSGGVVEKEIFMSEDCRYSVAVVAGQNFPIAGTIRNY